MEFTAGQQLALDAISAVSKSHPRGGGVVVISGYAGTGKTSMLKALAEADDELLILTPTGKAALRVREVTGTAATTIHSWMYEVSEDPKTGQAIFSHKEIDDLMIPGNGIVFVDEASMVGFDMFKDLYEFAKSLELNLVFIGDSFQLPPVETKMDKVGFSVFNVPANYRVQMTEVLRQAQESPIIRASMACRDPRTRLEFLGTDIKGIAASELEQASAEVYGNKGFVICHRNQTRHQINAGTRKLLGFGELIEEEEPLLVLQNDRNAGVYNGEIITIDSKPQKLNQMPYPVRDRFTNAACNVDFYHFMSPTLSGLSPFIVADREVFGTQGEVGFKAIRKAGRGLSKALKEGGDDAVPDPVISANFGYCLTAHKSQGSEAPDVLVCIEPSVRLGSEDGRRWLYVALTRAQNRVRVCYL